MDPMGTGDFLGVFASVQETPGQEVDQLGALGEMAKGGKVGIVLVRCVGWAPWKTSEVYLGLYSFTYRDQNPSYLFIRQYKATYRGYNML